MVGSSIRATAAGSASPDGAVDTACAVRVTGLVKSYGKVAAVAGVDFEISHGEVFALLGPRGRPSRHAAW